MKEEFLNAILNDPKIGQQLFDDIIKGHQKEKNLTDLFTFLLSNGFVPSPDALKNGCPEALSVYYAVKPKASLNGITAKTKEPFSPSTESTITSTTHTSSSAGDSNSNLNSNKRKSDTQDLKSQTLEDSHGLWVIKNMDNGFVNSALWKNLTSDSDLDKVFGPEQPSPTVYVKTIENLRDMVQELIQHADGLHKKLTDKDTKKSAKKTDLDNSGDFYKFVFRNEDSKYKGN